jgi:membrane protein
VVLGGVLQDWIGNRFGTSEWLLMVFAAFRWLMIVLALLLGFALIYYLGPDVEQSFKFITPGSVFGVALLIAASLGFKVYAASFGDYNATYGSIGAVIILMLWLYIAGLVILLGSEINALVEHYAPEGKEKGEKTEGEHGGAGIGGPAKAPPAPPPSRRR